MGVNGKQKGVFLWKLKGYKQGGHYAKWSNTGDAIIAIVKVASNGNYSFIEHRNYELIGDKYLLAEDRRRYYTLGEEVPYNPK